MTETLTVVLGDAVAGTVTRMTGGDLRFDYDESYRSRPGATPLSVSMPVPIASHGHRAITPWLWGLLPDNDAVLARWGRRFQVTPASPFSLLSSPVGEDCAGAVRFGPPDQVERMLSRTGEITWLTDEEVGQRLRELREDSTAWLGRTFTGQFSLAGAQAKTALLCSDGRWGVPSGATPTTHILKPAVPGLDDHDLNEHLCLNAARRCGLSAVKSEVREFAGESAIVIDRYDRIGDPTVEVRRVHQEDLCQALGIAPSHKYQNEGGPGPVEITALFGQIMSTGTPEATSRFIDALIWNWLIGGTDAHAKNYSLLLAGSQVRLAPLYDLASGLPYGDHEKKLRMAMKVGGDYRIYPWRNPWPAAAAELGVEPERMQERVSELATMAPDAFRDAAAAEEVRALGRDLPDRLVALVAERAPRCLAATG